MASLYAISPPLFISFHCYTSATSVSFVSSLSLSNSILMVSVILFWIFPTQAQSELLLAVVGGKMAETWNPHIDPMKQSLTAY